ncbi:MAG: tRNA (Thr-GGU) A37 N-methylase [Cocleimonas sp.]
MILVSDGEETCNAVSCAVSKELEAQGVNFTAHVIGFDVKNNKKALTQLKCIAENTGGQFYEADDAASLKESLIKVKEVVVDPRPSVCKPYSENGVTHEQTNIDKKCGFKGQHWSTNYTTHYDWCMTQDVGSTLSNQEQQKHVDQLNTCQTTKVKTVVYKTNIGKLQLVNNKQTYVRALDQNTGKQKGIFGTKVDSTIQLPAGTYRLKFNHFEIDDIKITAGEKNVHDVNKLIGWLSLSNNKQTYVRAKDQTTGKLKGVFGTNADSAIQLPVGTYKLRFNHFEIDDVKINAGEKNTFDVSKLIGWLSLSNNNEPYVKAIDQVTGKLKGVFGTKANSTIQLPAGTYKLKFNNFEIKDVVIEAGQKLEMKLE